MCTKRSGSQRKLKTSKDEFISKAIIRIKEKISINERNSNSSEEGIWMTQTKRNNKYDSLVENQTHDYDDSVMKNCLSISRNSNIFSKRSRCNSGYFQSILKKFQKPDFEEKKWTNKSKMSFRSASDRKRSPLKNSKNQGLAQYRKLGETIKEKIGQKYKFGNNEKLLSTARTWDKENYQHDNLAGWSIDGYLSNGLIIKNQHTFENYYTQEPLGKTKEINKEGILAPKKYHLVENKYSKVTKENKIGCSKRYSVSWKENTIQDKSSTERDIFYKPINKESSNSGFCKSKSIYKFTYMELFISFIIGRDKREQEDGPTKNTHTQRRSRRERKRHKIKAIGCKQIIKFS